MLCLTEKYHILFSGLNLLNKRNELVSKCRHENKYSFSNYRSVPSWQVAKLDDFLFKLLASFTTLNKRFSNQLDSMSHSESGYPQLITLFVKIIRCRKDSTALLNVYRVLYRTSLKQNSLSNFLFLQLYCSAYHLLLLSTFI